MGDKNDKKRTLSLNSTVSDLETSVTSSLTKEPGQKETKQSKHSKKKLKTSDTNMAQLEKKIEEINTKLSEMLTKKDQSFIKQILVDTLDEMKDKIIESVLHRVEVLESEVHEIAIEQTKQKEETQKIKQTIKDENNVLKEENKKLLKQISEEETNRKYAINDLEQYGRRLF